MLVVPAPQVQLSLVMLVLIAPWAKPPALPVLLVRMPLRQALLHALLALALSATLSPLAMAQPATAHPVRS
jgi:hypothetical protein